jgi:hypothetical protein
MANEFTFMGINNFNSSMEELIADGVKFKRELFDTNIMHRPPNKRSVTIFENSTYSFIKLWDDYADSLRRKLKDIDKLKNRNIRGTLVRDYDYIRKYVFVKYDYSSVLQYIDGIIKGVNQHKFEEVEDIKDFTEYTISQAFDNGSISVAELMEDLFSDIEGSYGPIEESEVNLFHQVKNYNDLFNTKDRYELTKAMKYSINFLTTNDSLVIKNPTYGSVKLYISIINNIVEYIIYTLLAFAGRIMVISDYCRPFITSYENSPELGGNPTIITERTTNVDGIKLSNITENPNGNTSNIFNTMDELLIKDPHRVSEFKTKFVEFLKLINITSSDIPGATPNYIDRLLRNDQTQYVSHETLPSNKFHIMLSSNPLYSWKSNSLYASNFISIKEMHHHLKDALFNRFQGLSGTTTFKDELINVIARVDVDTDIKDYKKMISDEDNSTPKRTSAVSVPKNNTDNHLKAYKKLAFDLYSIFLTLNHNIGCNLKDGSSSTCESERSRDSVTVRKLSAEINSYLINLYEEIMFAIAQKAKYIERKINILKEKSINDLFKSLSLDLNLTDAVELSVPPTTRMPIDFISLYTLPIFEEYQMFNKFLQSQPEFENDLYMEAGLADLKAKIMAVVIAIYEKFMKFYRGHQLANARDWISKNKSKLLSLDIPEEGIEIKKGLPYKADITIPSQLTKMADIITGFKPEDLKNVDAFIQSLYPNPQIYDKFKEDAEKGRIYYHNWIIFEKPTDQVQKYTPIRIFKKDFDSWLTNVSDSEQIAKNVENGFNKLKTSIDSLNQKLVNLTNKEEHSPEADSNTTNNNTQTGEGAPANTEDDNGLANASELFARINLALNNLWVPILLILMKLMVDEYYYMKEVYSQLITNAPKSDKPTIQNV